MLKKLAITTALLAATTGIAMADTAPYVGVSSGLIVNSASIAGNTLAYRGIPLNVFAGYGGLINCNFYLAGELQGTLTSGSITDDSGLKSTYGGSLSILPGFLLNETTMAFARLGVSETHFSNDSSTYRVGALFGAGIQTNIAQSLDVRLEYNYTALKSISLGDMIGSVSPRTDAVLLGLVYKFE